MQPFQLDSRLATDCIELGYFPEQQQTNGLGNLVLLMDNTAFPWFVIVPTNVDVIDIDELSESQQIIILKQVNRLSGFLKRHYPVDKINFATIGNIVKQMHFHLVARNESDNAWPGVVWGSEVSSRYTQAEIVKIKDKLAKEINEFKATN